MHSKELSEVYKNNEKREKDFKSQKYSNIMAEQEAVDESKGQVEVGRAGGTEGINVGHAQLYDLITGDDVSWQTIIYELINTEQLNIYDLDIAKLADSFISRVQKIEETDFFVSGRVLLAASLLLRLKADRVLAQLMLLDDLLFGRKDKEAKEKRKLYIDMSELPEILPRTPLQRARRITLEELMQALEKAMQVHERRVQRKVKEEFYEREIHAVLPRTTINVTDKIKEVFDKIKDFFLRKIPSSNKEDDKVKFFPNKIKQISEFSNFSDLNQEFHNEEEMDEGKDVEKYGENILKGNISEALTFTELVSSDRKEDKISTFIPLLYLETRKKILLAQYEHFGEIYIYNKIGERLVSEKLEAEDLTGDLEDMDDMDEESDEENLKDANSIDGEGLN